MASKNQKPVALPARAASFKPGFNGNRKRKEYILYAYPITELMNESIGVAQKDIGSGATRTTADMLPGYGEKDVYIVDQGMIATIISMQNATDCAFFKKYVESGHVVRYYPQVERARARRNELSGRVAKASRVKRS